MIPNSRSIAFCIGNGESRKGVDLDRLARYGPVIGCNALYRDCNPDALMCADGRMIKEAKDGGYTGPLYTAHMDYKEKALTLYDERAGKFVGGFKIQRWCSGPVTVGIARLVFRTKDVVLIGHDFNQSTDGLVNNLYKGTQNYDPPDHKMRKQGHFIASFQRCSLTWPDMYMYHVGPEQYRLEGLNGRMKWMTYEELWRDLETRPQIRQALGQDLPRGLSPVVLKADRQG